MDINFLKEMLGRQSAKDEEEGNKDYEETADWVRWWVAIALILGVGWLTGWLGGLY